MKKFITVLVVAAMLLSSFGIVCNASAEMFNFFDDFEDYEIMDVANTAGVFTVGNFSKSSVYRGSGWQGRYMSVQVIENPTIAGEKVMAMSSFGSGNQACLNLVADTSDAKNDMLFSADMYIPNKNGDASYGVRFMTSSNEKSYYEMYIPKHAVKITFRKVVEGEEKYSSTLTDMPNIASAKWMTLSAKIMGNNINYSVTYDGNTYSGTYKDASPFEIAVKDTKVQLASTGDSWVYYDNITYREFDFYAEGMQPENMMYYNAAAGFEMPDGVAFAKAENAVIARKIHVYSDENLEGKTLYGSNDDNFEDKTEICTITAEEVTDYGAEIINKTTKGAFKYWLVDSENVSNIDIYCEVTDTITVALGKTVDLLARIDGADIAETWTSSDKTVVTAENGKVVPVKKGKTKITASSSGHNLSVDIAVIGELENAVNKGTEEEYIASKQSVVDAINEAIKNNDKMAMESALTDEMPKILDFDSAVLLSFGGDKLSAVALRLLDSETFGNENITVADIENLIAAVSREVAVEDISGETDTDKILEKIEKYSDIYGIDITSEYYLKYKTEISSAFVGQTFEDILQIASLAEKIYVLGGFGDAKTSADYKNIIEKNAGIIGYDVNKYNAIGEKSDLYYSISDNKSQITTLEELRDFIDSFKAPYVSPVRNKFAFYDDIDSYELKMNERTEAVQYIGDNFKTSAVYRGSGWQGIYMTTGVAGNPANSYEDDRVMLVKGYGANNYACVNLIADRNGISSNTYGKADIFGKSVSARFGIRTAVSSDEKSYYELATKQQGNSTLTFRKVQNDEVKYESDLELKAPVGSWMTFSVGVAGNNIVYSVTVNGNTETGVYVDPQPYILTGNSATMQFMCQGDQGDVYVNNVEYRDFDVYTESQTLPKDMVYYDVAFDKELKTEDSGYSIAFGKTEVIRKIKAYSSGNFAENVKFYLANEADLSDKVLIGTSNSENINGNICEFINRTTAEPYRLVYVEGADISKVAAFIETDPTDVIKTVAGDKTELFAVINNKTDGVSYQSGNAIAATVVDGVLRSRSEGTAVITAKDENGNSRSVKVQVAGEISSAEAAGKTQEYLDEKRPVIEKINKAIKENDSATIETVLKTEISVINDFDADMVSDIIPGDLTLMAKRIVNGTPFCDASGNIGIEDVKNLIDTLIKETVVALASNRETGDAVKDSFEKYSDYYGVDMQNKYFLAYETETYDALKKRTFTSLEEVKTAFEKAYAFIAFDKNESVLKYRSIVEDNAAAIGYDADNYADIADKGSLYDAIARDKDTITDIDKLKDYIDSYEPEKSGGGSGGGGSFGGGGGAGGGSSFASSGTAAFIESQKPVGETSPYSDLQQSHWAYESVSVLSARKIINGYENGTFVPDKNVTRAEFAKMLVCAFNLEKATPEDAETVKVFEDVAENDWYYEYIMAAYENGVLKGDGGYANPQKTITREEMSVMVFRILNSTDKLLEKESVTVFADDASISEWAFTSVKNLQANGIVNGMPDGRFDPAGAVTRAQAAKIIFEATK